MQVAFALLRAGHGERLLITGVVHGANSLELARLRAVDPVLFASAVDLDESAVTTADNARVAAAWAQGRFDSLVVVSSAWHLPRSLAALGRAAPDMTLAPASPPCAWPWPELPLEWAKFLGTRAGMGENSPQNSTSGGYSFPDAT